MDKAKQEFLALLDAFAFATPRAKAAFVAGLLTLVARQSGMLHGPAPLFFVVGPRGCGKGMLCQLVLLAAGKREGAGFFAPSRNDSETSTALSGALAKGTSIMIFDNVDESWGSAPVVRALTGTRWKVRDLGHNESELIPISCTFWATGLRLPKDPDLSRRLLPIELEVAAPEPARSMLVNLAASSKLRRGLRELAQDMLSHRTAAGSKRVNGRPRAGFEDWDRTIRHAVVSSGLADPYEGIAREQRNRRGGAQASDGAIDSRGS
jgi:hypothetical protein